ncbi:MAG: 16S rRNA (cytidine(1402)-2'-O)-methyltransferase [Bacteroidota bacterium]|nr:16S rRNA (cytidine(1402)-2'-O)-methyltransferase [Bacteroidota bacterium]
MSESGRLYLVPTPIGNLKDITLRALEVLKNSDVILAEDTRNTGVLLKHFEIDKPMQSYHAHNEHEKIRDVIYQLQNGKTMSLVTDAGTPGISDPGFLIVRECIANKIAFECLPGATALIPALVKSGMPTDKFVFEGFLPVKKGRKTRLDFLKNENRTLVFYESPYKLLTTLKDFITWFGEERQVAVSREISKMFEETLHGSLSEIHQHFTKKAPKGEFVIVLKGKENE